MYKIWKYLEKGQPHACDYRMHETGRICPELNHLADFAVSWNANFLFMKCSPIETATIFLYTFGEKHFARKKKLRNELLQFFLEALRITFFFYKADKLCDWKSCLSVFWKLGITLINKGSVIFLSSLIIWKFIINFHEIAIKKNCKISKLANWSNFSKNSGNLLNFLTNVSSLMCKGKAFISYE